MKENLGLIGFFALTTFLANLVFSAMGVGMAIIFLFCYQIGVISNLIEENLKYAVFIQTFALFVIQPMVLSSVNLKKNAKMDLLVPFILVQFIGTPIGQWPYMCKVGRVFRTPPHLNPEKWHLSPP